jgi:hypothetical protein
LRGGQAQRLVQHATGAPIHLLRRAPAEGEQHQSLRVRAVADQVGHAVRERVGLAGTGPRDHQQRPRVVRLLACAVPHGRELIGIQIVQDAMTSSFNTCILIQ